MLPNETSAAQSTATHIVFVQTHFMASPSVKKRDGRLAPTALSFGTPTGTRTIPASDAEAPIPKTGAAESAALPADLAPELTKVIAAWPIIGERGKATILGIARAAERKATARKEDQ